MPKEDDEMVYLIISEIFDIISRRGIKENIERVAAAVANRNS